MHHELMARCHFILNALIFLSYPVLLEWGEDIVHFTGQIKKLSRERLKRAASGHTIKVKATPACASTPRVVMCRLSATSSIAWPALRLGSTQPAPLFGSCLWAMREV